MTSLKRTVGRRAPSSVLASFCMVLSVGVLIAGCASTALMSPPGPHLTASAFGPEQWQMYGIVLSFGFAPDPDVGTEAVESPESGLIRVRGEDIGVLRARRAGETVLAVDTDRDRSFADEQYAPADGTVVLRTIEFGDERVLVQVTVGPEGKGEYLVRELWQLTIASGNESLDVGILRIGQGITFGDADGDGVFETYMPPGNSVSLGGRFWELVFDFGTRAARLVPTDQVPVATGYEAPTAEGTQLETEERVDLVADGAVTVLVFCSANCHGCRQIADSLEAVSARFVGNSAVRLISVARSADEARGCRESVCPSFTHVVAPKAWEVYAVTPTPTIVVVDKDGIIRYRGPGAGAGTADLLFKVLDDVR